MKEIPTPTIALSPAILPRGSLHPSCATTASLQPSKSERSGIRVAWAQHEDEVREAQKLRFNVFANEMGAQLLSLIHI